MDHPPSDDELETTLRVLRLLCEQPHLCLSPDGRYAELRQRAGRLLKALRTRERLDNRQRDRDLLDATGIRLQEVDAAEAPLLPAPAAEAEPALCRPRDCYACKQPFTRPHHFYDSLCPACAEHNYARRLASADLTGRVALVTGGRVKIGYQVVLKLLRAGASVIATTRFPHDAAARYAREDDFAAWADRLSIQAIDLRHLPSVERFCAYLGDHHPHLDVLINNAAQTVRRPPAFYRHLIERLPQDLSALPPRARALLGNAFAPRDTLLPAENPLLSTFWPAFLSQAPLLPGDDRHDPQEFPPGQLDRDRQQIDRRAGNSWSARPDAVATPELLEVHAVNCLAPFLLVTRLEPLLRRSPFADRYVVNVSAREGMFQMNIANGAHAHTNMAKAALNMLTRTSAEHYAALGIYLTSVDTGWISNESPYPVAQQMSAEGFRLPLDALDGAARVLDPVFTGITTGQPRHGQLYKDYREVPW
jgi:NAD(P)-dependent dehydrogenase (short-subunit alcohol dehydrogenase family)